MTFYRRLTAIFVLALGCRSGTTPPTVDAGKASSEMTGLEGTAHVGPVRPVCRVDKPCTAPFSANFEVWQGDRVVARFRSDSAGHFLVRLAPGTYTVAPDASAGILIRSQVHKLTVKSGGLTHVELSFDKGIQ